MQDELKNIIQKVKYLFTKYGIKSVSMDDIARELGISKKTLYQYVEDKAALVKLAINYEVEHRVSCYEILLAKNYNAIEQLFEVNKMLAKHSKEFNSAIEYDLRKYYPDIYQFLRLMRRNSMLKHIFDNLEKGKSEGLYRTNLNSMIVAKLHVSRVEAMIDTDIFTSEEILSEDFFLEIFTFHLYGICSEEGREFVNKKLIEFKTT